MKKNLFKAALGCIALATLAACSGESPPQTYPNTFPTSSKPSKEDRMLYAVEDLNINMDRPQKMAYAARVCEDLREGFTSREILVFRMSEVPEVELMDHASLVGASVGSHCPEFMAQVDAEWE